MAKVYTDFAGLQFKAIPDASKAPNLKAFGGNVHYLEVIKDAYTAATADPLVLARLPKGARLIPSLCSVDYSDPGDALTGKLGFEYPDGTGDDDAYGAALALGNADGRKRFDEAGTKGAAFLAPVKFTDDAWIVATWTTATVPVAHKQTWHLAYTLG